MKITPKIIHAFFRYFLNSFSLLFLRLRGVYMKLMRGSQIHVLARFALEAGCVSGVAERLYVAPKATKRIRESECHMFREVDLSRKRDTQISLIVTSAIA